MNSESVFIDDRILVTPQIESLRAKLEEKFNISYIIKSALGTDDEYEYQEGIIILIPKHSILVVDCNNNSSSEFDTFVDEIIEDLGYLSKKYEYQKVLGRISSWRKLVDVISLESLVKNFDNEIGSRIVSLIDERRVELLISLFIGSINDPLRVGAENPESDLMKVKKNIILFDSTQSRFIFESSDNKVLTIQGLAGTGKTELLLHKLQKLYVKENDSRIAFTCFNRVLANDMESRVTNFFNFMHVDKQIEWDKRLWVFRSWGSGNEKNSGLYSYICDYYGIPFIRYSQNHDFGAVCKTAYNQIKDIDNMRPCFDYLLIDESQDFTKAFFDLCELVTKRQVIRAGDIFQNIFDISFNGSVECDYLLNKCYRTDPRTLMFAHSIGMGLYEHPVIRWLEDNEWRACGYEYVKKEKNISFIRSPIRRFQDISPEVKSVELISTQEDDIIPTIIKTLKGLYEQYTDITPDDIGIVLTSRLNSSYSLMDSIAYSIEEEFHVNVTRGHVTKYRTPGTVFVSNINNIKGLEFPFIICVHQSKITHSVYQRNAIYMALTRSFLTSFFIVASNVNKDFIEIYKKAANEINDLGIINVPIPSQEEIDAQKEKIRIETQRAKKSMSEIIEEVCLEQDGFDFEDSDMRNRLEKIVALTLSDHLNPTEGVIRGVTLESLGLIQKNRGANYEYT